MARLTSILFAFLVAAASTTVASPAPGWYPPPASCTQCTSSPNNCDITAPCSSFVGKLFCGCRPGYKATGVADGDTTQQWRIDTLPDHTHRVWVAPGVVCDTLCDAPYGTDVCGEVAIADQCAA